MNDFVMGLSSSLVFIVTRKNNIDSEKLEEVVAINLDNAKLFSKIDPNDKSA